MSPVDDFVQRRQDIFWAQESAFLLYKFDRIISPYQSCYGASLSFAALIRGWRAVWCRWIRQVAQFLETSTERLASLKLTYVTVLYLDRRLGVGQRRSFGRVATKPLRRRVKEGMGREERSAEIISRVVKFDSWILRDHVPLAANIEAIVVADLLEIWNYHWTPYPPYIEFNIWIFTIFQRNI